MWSNAKDREENWSDCLQQTNFVLWTSKKWRQTKTEIYWPAGQVDFIFFPALLMTKAAQSWDSAYLVSWKPMNVCFHWRACSIRQSNQPFLQPWLVKKLWTQEAARKKKWNKNTSQWTALSLHYVKLLTSGQRKSCPVPRARGFSSWASGFCPSLVHRVSEFFWGEDFWRNWNYRKTVRWELFEVFRLVHHS